MEKTGTCQLCLRTFKLGPQGVSRHGFKKRYGCQAGTCRGSLSLPLESGDRSVIETHIRELAATLEDPSLKLRARERRQIAFQLGSLKDRLTS